MLPPRCLRQALSVYLTSKISNVTYILLHKAIMYATIAFIFLHFRATLLSGLFYHGDRDLAGASRPGYLNQLPEFFKIAEKPDQGKQSGGREETSIV